MNKSRKIASFSVLMVIGVWVACEIRIHATSASVGGIGPDAIIADLPRISRWGSDDEATSFSLGMEITIVPIGPLQWWDRMEILI
ncbi:MAG: hypothetical protein AAGA30_17180 [Planctomycetota bacterium]